jgi:hypothetical protein
MRASTRSCFGDAFARNGPVAWWRNRNGCTGSLRPAARAGILGPAGQRAGAALPPAAAPDSGVPEAADDQYGA